MVMTVIFFNEFHWEVEMIMTLGILRVEDIKIDSGIGTIVSQEPNDRLCRSSGNEASYQGSIHIDAQYTTYTCTVQGLCLNIFFFTLTWSSMETIGRCRLFFQKEQ
jgi:hypothetical protein